MSETALKFGPEWLRVLSHGGISSPPPSPGPVKFKMAEFRYGREEMLALFSKDFLPPEESHGLGSLYLQVVQEPLAFLPMNAEEQRMWQRCVNSEAVLRGTGRAPINGVGRGRGGSVDRGRGRGRGVGAPYYSRGLSYDEEPEVRGVPREEGPPGIMSVRGKGYERSHSMNDSRVWGERVSTERGPPGTLEERSGAGSPRKEQNRAAAENWRSRASEEEKDRWRVLGNATRVDKWGGRIGWREREEGEWDENRGPPGGMSRSSRPPWEMERDKNSRRTWEEDNLPEWATEEMEEKGGSFDATGAFHAPGSSDENEHNIDHENMEANPIMNKKPPETQNDWPDEKLSDLPPVSFQQTVKDDDLITHVKDDECMERTSPMVNGIICEEDESSLSPSPPQIKQKVKHYSKLQLDGSGKATVVEEDNLDHMQSVADDLVAKLVEEDDMRPHNNKPHSHLHHPPPGGFIPQSDHLPSPEEQWYYTDPQGDIQGPFSSSDMAAWYKAGYFKASLLLRRHCDDKFAQLGDLTRVFGRVPFLPGPAVPPLKVSELLNAQKAQAERERYELMQTHQLQKLYQHQVALRQQQLFQQLQNLEEWNTLTPIQQQQLYMQHLMALPPLPPPTLPPSLQTSSSSLPPCTISSAISTPLPTPSDPRSVISSSSLPKPQDPIQALVAQMTTSKTVPVGNTSEPPAPPQVGSLPPSESPQVSGESPLQKLLLQLQRGTQGAAAGNLSSSGTTPTFTSHPPNAAAHITSSSVALEKGPEQFDPIQSLVSQLSKIQAQNTPPEMLQQEEKRQRDEDQKRIEEERRRFEEQKKAEEERMKQQELRLQEERQREEEKRKELEEKNQRLEEELRRIQIEQNKRKQEAESKRKEEERKRIQLVQQQKAAEAAKKEEEQKRLQKMKQKQEDELRKKEEAARKQEEKQRIEEEKRKKEERKRLEEEKRQEEERRKKIEKERQMQIQEEMRRVVVEEEKKRMQQLKEEEKKRAALEEQEKKQQQALQEKMKQTPPAWSNPPNSEKNSAPSLAEIQKTQEIKEKKEREAESQREVQRQKEALKQAAAEEKKQKEVSNKWGSRSSQSSKSSPNISNLPEQTSPSPIKSLLEIQKEEEKELKKRMEKEQAERAAAVSHLSLNAAGVWGSAAQSLSWANRASTGASVAPPPPQPQPLATWGGAGANMAWAAVAQTNSSSTSASWTNETQPSAAAQSSGGFWESPDTVKTSKSSGNIPAANASRSSTTTKAALPAAANTKAPPANEPLNPSNINSSNSKVSKKKTKDENQSVKKLFMENISPADNFTQWCKFSLHSMKVHASIDIPTFVGFLGDVESPYEVHDYIRSYLGDSKEVKEFAKQYLERRSKARNAHKISHDEDNILAPAPAVNPVSNQEFQEVKTRLKKGGRRKMQKVDSSILGFNLSNVEGN